LDPSSNGNVPGVTPSDTDVLVSRDDKGEVVSSSVLRRIWCGNAADPQGRAEDCPHYDPATVDPTVGKENRLLTKAKALWRGGDNRDELAAQISQYGFDSQRSINTRNDQVVTLRDAGTEEVPRSTMVPLKMRPDERISSWRDGMNGSFMSGRA
jgi:hypothetical protein